MTTAEASWNNTVIASSDHCIVIEGNKYFPPDSLKMEFFASSAHTSVCSWKGDANYYDVIVDGKTNANAAWVYQNPKSAASEIKGYVAFWKGVEVK